MRLRINGDFQNMEQAKINITDIINQNNVKMPEMVSVQLNGKFVERNNFSDTYLAENDEIDFLYFMGGGA